MLLSVLLLEVFLCYSVWEQTYEYYNSYTQWYTQSTFAYYSHGVKV